MPSFIIYRLVLALVFALGCFAGAAQAGNPAYNKALADSLGGDENGMKKYVLAILKTGPAEVTDKAIRDSLFRGHMANIDRLANGGKLIIAGPLQKNERTYRGIFILNVPTVEEAKALVLTDPAVKAGIFEIELFQWFGSAALPMYLPYHDKVVKKKM